MSHANDPAILMRLRRAEGHLATITRMLQEGRSALDIAQQMQAVVKALEKAKQMLIIDHIEHHVEDPKGNPSDDLREIIKYL